MSCVRGHTEYKRFQAGQRLGLKAAQLAQCFVCNGEGEGGMDCQVNSCPLYQHMPYNANRSRKAMTERSPAQLAADKKLAARRRKLP